MLNVLKQVSDKLTAPDEMFAISEADVLGYKKKVWKNSPNSLREVWLDSAKFAERDYLVYNDERWTYQQAHDEVARIANWLVTNGIKQHDRVAIAMRNYPEWMLCYWAIVSVGAVAVGVNAWWVPEELAYGFNDSKPKVLICDSERLNNFTEIRDDFTDMLVVGVRVDELPSWAISWQQVLESNPIMPDVTIAPDDDACIFYTSGTTGFPKGAQLTHRSCVNQLLSCIFARVSQVVADALAKGEQAPDLLDPNADQATGLVSTPLFHVTANNTVFQVLTTIGGKLVHMYKWHAGEALSLIEKEKVTAFSGVPVMAREIINHPDFHKTDTSSLTSLGGGGAPFPPDLTETIDVNDCPILPAQGYGLTETSGMAISSMGTFLSLKPSSTGVVTPICDVKTIDEHGNDLPSGEIGEICIYGACVVKGYLNRPEATAETIVDGWLHTGDVGYIDEDNFVFLVDRIKDMVLRGGENVYCTEVESAVYQYSGIAECSVFSVPDERLGEEVGAAIYLLPNTTINIDELRTYLKGKLAAFKIPRYFWIMEQPLPKNANGKFVKRTLQELVDVAEAL